MTRRLLNLVLLLGVTVALPVLTTLPQTAAAAHRPPSLLQVGSTGPRTAGLQWMLGGNRPSVYRGLSTFPWKPNGLFGRRTAAAVVEMKRRLGFPDRALQPIAGRDLFDILTGKRPRPLGYLMRATRRLAAEKEIDAARASTACAQKVISVARGELGQHEIPWGSNWGGHVPLYLAASHIDFAAPWCMAFAQYVFRQARVGFPGAWAGAIADDSAGVFYVAGWARAHGWLRSIPQPAFIALFVDRLGHAEVVERVTTTGFYSVGGNSSNAVRENFHPFGARPTVFVQVPGCSGG